MSSSRTTIAMGQLAVMALAVAALVVMAVTRSISSPTVDALFGVILGHVGIIAYNGATSAPKPTGTTVTQHTIEGLYAQALQANPPAAPAYATAQAPAPGAAQAPAPAPASPSAEGQAQA